MTRSSFSNPESLSISYLQREPCGISMIALTTRGAFFPVGTPCQGWETVIITGAIEKLSFMLQDFFQIYQPIAIDTDDPDSGGIPFVTVGIGVGGHRIIDVLNVDRQDIRIFILLPFFVGHAIIPLPPHVEQDLIGGVVVQKKFGLVIIAVEGGPDELATGVLGVVRFFEGMDVIAGG